MRALKFLGVFLGTLIIIFFIVFGFRLDALTTLLQNKKGIQEGQPWVAKVSSLKGLTQYVGAQPEHVSIASYAIGAPDFSILYNQHAPRTMGRLANLFYLIEYAHQVENGTINPDKLIPLDSVNRYQLPYINRSDHQNALAALDDQDKITDNQTVALKHLVRTGLIFNDVAISDFLFYKLGPSNITALMDRLAIKETELPLPFCGLYITLNPHLTNTTGTKLLDSLSTLPRHAFKKLVLNNAQKFLTNKSYHKKVKSVFEEQTGLGIKFVMQRDALVLFPKTTAAELSQVIKKLQADEVISETVSQKVLHFLKWPMEQDDQFRKLFKTYGALYDNRMGMINGINFGTPAKRNQQYVQAIFFDELQIGFWFHMSSNMMEQDFQQSLLWKGKLRQQTRNAIQHPERINTPTPPES